MAYTLEFAKYKDAQDIQNLLYPDYFEASIYSGLDYDPVSTLQYIYEWISEYCVLARDDAGSIVGILGFYLANTYYKQKECDIVIFYIHPDHRGKGVSRMLVKFLNGFCEKRGDVGVIYTTSGSGMSEKNNMLYTNLFKKEGFEVLGTELIRIIDDE